MSSIHDRILELAKKEGISISKLERTIEVGTNSLSTSLRRKAAISHKVIQQISQKYPKYSLYWLVLGKHQSPKEELLDQVVEIVKGANYY